MLVEIGDIAQLSEESKEMVRFFGGLNDLLECKRSSVTQGWRSRLFTEDRFEDCSVRHWKMKSTSSSESPDAPSTPDSNGADRGDGKDSIDVDPELAEPLLLEELVWKELALSPRSFWREVEIAWANFSLSCKISKSYADIQTSQNTSCPKISSRIMQPG